MKTQNTIKKRKRISEAKLKLIAKYFSLDFTANDVSKLVKLNRKTINKYYNILRGLVKEKAEDEMNKIEHGEVEIDESYFGARRVRGKRGRGAGNKVPVFGLLKRDGLVYTEVVKSCSKESLLPIIKGNILEGVSIYSDGWKSYDGLILYGYKHKRVHHHENEFARGKNHVNGIESFWSFVKRRMIKFNGIKKDNFLLYLKESEWRFNHRNDDIYKLLYKDFLQKCLDL